MQLKKQARKLTRDASQLKPRVINIKSFNPVLKPGLEIISASTLHNLEGVTHLVYTTQIRRGV